MKASQVFETLANAGIQAEAISLRDQNYALFDRAWLAQIFAPALAQFFQNLGDATYVGESNDCDDFADGAAFYARYLHHIAGRADATSPAFGTFTYMQASGEGHCLNCLIVSGADGVELIFFEPQTGQFVALTSAESAGCTEARI